LRLDIHQRLERGEGVTADTMMKLMDDLLPKVLADKWRLITIGTASSGQPSGISTPITTCINMPQAFRPANALAQRILAGAPQAAEDYLRFLKAGNSVYALDALKIGRRRFDQAGTGGSGLYRPGRHGRSAGAAGGLISIIIPTLNEAENILKTIESVRQQNQEAEIIVADAVASTARPRSPGRTPGDP